MRLDPWYSVVQNLPEDYQADLPSPQAIVRLTEGWKNAEKE
jgi:hypothetical protein